MMSLPDRSRVLVSGSSVPGAAGSGICLTHTTTFMADHLCGPGPFPAIRPGDRPFPGLAQARPPPAATASASPRRSVMTASTPHATMARRSSGALTVQTLTARPSACARSTSSGSTEHHEGVDGPEARPRPPRRGPARDRSAKPQSAPRARRAVGRLDGAQRGDLERRDDDPVGPAGLLDRRRRQRRHGLAGIPRRVLGGVLDLDVDGHPLAHRQDVGQERHVGGQVRHAELADHTETRDLGVVVDGQGPVGGQAHVELDPVGPEPTGLGERVERVLDESLGATPVSEDGGHGSRRRRARHGSTASACGKFTQNSLPGPRRAVTLLRR